MRRDVYAKSISDSSVYGVGFNSHCNPASVYRKKQKKKGIFTSIQKEQLFRNTISNIIIVISKFLFIVFLCQNYFMDTVKNIRSIIVNYAFSNHTSSLNTIRRLILKQNVLNFKSLNLNLKNLFLCYLFKFCFFFIHFLYSISM